jgi:hypothetical protein
MVWTFFFGGFFCPIAFWRTREQGPKGLLSANLGDLANWVEIDHLGRLPLNNHSLFVQKNPPTYLSARSALFLCSTSLLYSQARRLRRPTFLPALQLAFSTINL